MNKATPMSRNEIDDFIVENPDWQFENDRLKADFTFTDFDAAMSAVEKVAEVAREMDHHPLWTNVYNRLSFSLCTHSAGDKVTKLDIQLAEKISNLDEQSKRE